MSKEIEKQERRKKPEEVKTKEREQKKEENPILLAIKEAARRAEEKRGHLTTVPKTRQKTESPIEQTKDFEKARALALELGEWLNKAKPKDIDKIWA